MATELIPGLGYVELPTSSGTELIPGGGYVEFEVAGAPAAEVFIENLTDQICNGMKAQTAAQLNGVLVT